MKKKKQPGIKRTRLKTDQNNPQVKEYVKAIKRGLKKLGKTRKEVNI